MPYVGSTLEAPYFLPARSAFKPAVSSYSSKSIEGHTPENPTKKNQDALIIHPQLGLDATVSVFAVCDGHGIDGGEVSQYIRRRLPVLLNSDKNMPSNPKRALLSSIIKTNSELNHAAFDASLSGTTLALVLIQRRALWCANVGDSRAVLAKEVKSNSWVAVALSRDHKAEERDEYTRIRHCGGRVQAYEDEQGDPIGPFRV